MERVVNTEIFIRTATEIHNGRYDYSKSIYIKSRIKVEIICPTHGSFWQMPNAHLYGQGCSRCRNGVGIIKRGLIISRKHPKSGTDKRQCSRCKKKLNRDCFTKSTQLIDGLRSVCKDCAKKDRQIYIKKNIDKIRKQRSIKSKKLWVKYKEEHKDEIEQRKKDRERISLEKRILAKTVRMLRSRIRSVIKNKTHRGHVYDLLGCSVEYFRFYIESQFKEGMSWDNHTYYGWHLDHIIPCAFFDMNNDDDIKKCFHYTNYQPLWRKHNQIKGSIYTGVKCKSGC